MASSTTIPRPVSSPAALASAVFGRMPTAMTSRLQGSVRPSLSFSPATRPPSPRIASEWAPRTVSTPRARIASVSR